jgi:methenyltetrahydromethanopterin cyclohydrolase
VLSVNKKARELVRMLCATPEEYGVSVQKTQKGATLVDAGVDTKGGFEAGRLITEICMGGLGKARIFVRPCDDLQFPAISVFTDHPAVATLGCQFAGWQVDANGFSAICSGPGRALALKPSRIFQDIKYADKADTAVLVLEMSEKPNEALISSLSRECNVIPSQLYVILVPTMSLAGSVQISGRVVEAGLHKLTRLGLDPLCVDCAWGWAPIAPVHPEVSETMGRTNDAILYGGVASYVLRHNDDKVLKALLKAAPSSASKAHGRLFKDVFREAGADFFMVDPDLFAPAVFWVTNVTSGSTFRAGATRMDLLVSSWNLTSLR